MNLNPNQPRASIADSLSLAQCNRLRRIKLTPTNKNHLTAMLKGAAQSEEIVEQFFIDLMQFNPYKALLILEGYERDGFYRIGTTHLVSKLLLSFLTQTVVKSSFNTPIWALTTAKVKELRGDDVMEATKAQIKSSNDVIAKSNVIQFPGFRRHIN
jgi:hypothetical protein